MMNESKKVLFFVWSYYEMSFAKLFSMHKQRKSDHSVCKHRISESNETQCFQTNHGF